MPKLIIFGPFGPFQICARTGMIMDNSFIIPWISSLDFQITINNKARFMNFLLIFWTFKYLSFFRVISFLFFCFSLKFSPSLLQKMNSQFCFIYYSCCFLLFFTWSFHEVLKHLIKQYSLNWVFLKKIPWSLYLHIWFW